MLPTVFHRCRQGPRPSTRSRIGLFCMLVADLYCKLKVLYIFVGDCWLAIPILERYHYPRVKPFLICHLHLGSFPSQDRALQSKASEMSGTLASLLHSLRTNHLFGGGQAGPKVNEFLPTLDSTPRTSGFHQSFCFDSRDTRGVSSNDRIDIRCDIGSF